MTYRAEQPAFPMDESTSPSFEELYARLGAITEQLERGDLPLAESTALYEEGMRLARECQRLLAEVEQRVEMLRSIDDLDSAGYGDIPLDAPFGAPLDDDR